MTITRRRLLKILASAGVAVPVCGQLYPVYEAYARDRVSDADVRGPGLESFSRSVCRDCANHCSLSLRLIDELPIGLRGTAWHPGSQGALCVAGQSQLQAVFDPDRVATPLRRADAGEASSPVTWDEGMSILAAQIRPLLAEGRGDRLVVVDGRTPSLGTRLVEAWTQAIPGARYVPLRVESAMDRMLGEFLGGGYPGRSQLDLAHAGALLLVGFELLEIDGSPVSQMRIHGDRRASDQYGNYPTIYLGPRQGPTAVKADLWIPCRPGKEREILLGLAESIARDHPDRDRLLREYAYWVPEADDAAEFARHYSLENVAHRQGLNYKDLLALRQALISGPTAVIMAGPALLRRTSGAAEARAALALNIWTGGFSPQGGYSWVEDPLAAIAASAGLPNAALNNPSALGDVLQPLLEIKRSPVEVMICIEANLAHELPGQDQVMRALTHVPFLASLATHDDETATLSHLTLPTLTDLESWDLPAPAWGQVELAVQVQRPAMSAVVPGRTPADVFLELTAAGVSGAGFHPAVDTSEELVAAGVAGIVQAGRGQLVGPDGSRFLSAVSQTTAQRSLLAGEAIWLAESAPAATPGHKRAQAPSVPAPSGDLAPGQLWLVPFDGPSLQGGRVLNRTMLMELSGYWQGLAWQTWVELHPADARRLSVKSGDMVHIRGPRAEIQARVVVTRSMTEGVVAVPVGMGHRAMGEVTRGHGANPLALPNAALDEVTGTPSWGPLAVFMAKV